MVVSTLDCHESGGDSLRGEGRSSLSSRVAANRSCNTRRPARFLCSRMVARGFGNLSLSSNISPRNYPERKLWPTDPRARAHARIVATEMHAGFQPLRKSCPMNLWLPVKSRPQSEEVMANVRRIEFLWADCRARFGQGGSFLFGQFGAADAMYAPVVARLHSYGLRVGEEARNYMDAVMALPAWAEWRTAALKESWILKDDEPEWPLVRGVPVA